MSENSVEKELFIAQYNQAWDQRRQHVTLIWTIPTVGGAVVAFALSQIPLEKLNIFSVHFLFLMVGIFSVGAVRIFLRHNFFQRVYGLLLADLEKEKKPIVPLPQIGDELLNRYYEKIKSDFWEIEGSKYKGINSWMIIMASLGLSLVVLWLDLTNLPTTVCPHLFTSLPSVGLKSCFSVFLVVTLALLLGFVMGAFSFLKKSHIKAKFILFVIGSLLLISNAVIMGFGIPNINLKLQNISDGLSDTERKITEKAFKMRDYQTWDGKAENTRNTLILLEGLNLINSDQYRGLGESLKVETSLALHNLATVADLDADLELKQTWPKMTADQLQDEKKKIGDKNPSPFKNLFTQRDKLEVEKNQTIKSLSSMNLFTAIAQGIALLLLAASELLFKFEDKEENSPSSGQGRN